MAARKKKQDTPEPISSTPENGPEPKRDVWIERLTWEGIDIEVKYEADWLGCNAKHGHNNAHLELRAVRPEKAVLPVTDTGYRSLFHQPGPVEAAGGPAAFVKNWLDLEAKSRWWKAYLAVQATPKQLDLFG